MHLLIATHKACQEGILVRRNGAKIAHLNDTVLENFVQILKKEPSPFAPWYL